jgi:predicted cobalt transporter CbtA
VLAILGFTVKSLLWLAILGIVLLVATGIFGAIQRRTVTQ